MNDYKFYNVLIIYMVWKYENSIINTLKYTYKNSRLNKVEISSMFSCFKSI